MATPQPAGTEAMAFQILLRELGTLKEGQQALERGLQQMVPLLTKIIAHLEAQAQQAEVPVATWAQTYPESPGVPESEAVPAPPETPYVPVPSRWHRVWRWFQADAMGAEGKRQ